MQFIYDLEKKLKLENFNDFQIVDFINKKTGIDHQHIALVLLIVSSAVLVCCKQGQNFLLVTFGFFYPFYKSFSELRKQNNINQWLIYWIFFSLFFSFKFVSDFFICFLPFGKIILILIFFAIYSSQINGYIVLEQRVFKYSLGQIPNKYYQYLKQDQQKDRKTQKKEPRIKSARSLKIPKNL